jgi:hypothetical protein
MKGIRDHELLYLTPSITQLQSLFRQQISKKHAALKPTLKARVLLDHSSEIQVMQCAGHVRRAGCIPSEI